MSRSPTTLVEAANLSVSTPQGRQLFQDLNVEISQDQVAMIGRNGVWNCPRKVDSGSADVRLL